VGFLTYLFMKLLSPIVQPPNYARGVMEPGSRVYVLFTVNSKIQVLQFGPPYSTLPTPDEYFWRETTTGMTYGPFKTLNETLTHYTWMVSAQKAKHKESSIIYVDFKRKKRVEL